MFNVVEPLIKSHEELQYLIENKLTRIRERVTILVDKGTEYSGEVLENLNEDLTDALRNLKKGK